MNAQINNEPGTKSPAPVTHSALHITSSAPVQVTLLVLYSLPLILLIYSAVVTSDFKYESRTMEVTLQIVTQYVETLREAFATFVIPFVTALAAGRWSNSTEGGLKPLHLFFILVAILLSAIVILAYMNASSSDIQESLNLSPEEASSQVKQAIGIASSYVKELLIYISLLLGVSIWNKG